jgi:hypothetical protein
MMKHVFLMGVLATLVGLAGATPLAAQAAGAKALGSVTITRKVLADGQPLAAGTYMVRLTDEMPAAAVGESSGSERWVEFVQSGKVKGREVASVVPDTEIAQIAEGRDKPTRGGHRVVMLKGNDFLRVWINRDGYNYLIHLPPA